MKSPPLQKVYNALFARWGKQHWWPAESPLEMMLGAILTQNTAWTNVEKAISNLKTNNALSLDQLEQTPIEQLAEWIRPAGYFNQKANTIKTIVQTINERFNGSLTTLFSLNTPTLRNELLSWKGVGSETADSILLYAGKRPVFVIDAYTRRFLERHGWINKTATYNDVAQLFMDQLPPQEELFNEYHALIVQLGKEHCKSKPNCENCPLNPYAPPTKRERH